MIGYAAIAVVNSHEELVRRLLRRIFDAHRGIGAIIDTGDAGVEVDVIKGNVTRTGPSIELEDGLKRCRRGRARACLDLYPLDDQLVRNVVAVQIDEFADNRGSNRTGPPVRPQGRDGRLGRGS